MDDELSTGAERATRMLRRAMLALFGFFLVFAVGGVLLVYDAAKNGEAAVSEAGCVSGPSILGQSGSCSASHSLVLPIVLVAVGFVGFTATMLVTGRWAVKTLGVGMMAYLNRERARRRSMGSMPGFPGGPGGFPPPGTPGSPTDPWPGGLPPGTPGSPTGPPLP